MRHDKHALTSNGMRSQGSCYYWMANWGTGSLTVEMNPARPIFDILKKQAPNGAEYWMARDIQAALGYASWRSFEEVMERARMACEASGAPGVNHFVETSNMVPIGSGAQRPIKDYFLSRYACYLIAMNGDPSKLVIAQAQTYFAVQTRRQEIADEEASQDARIALRQRVRDANKYLGSAAKQAGVQNYAMFHDAGYRGLYGMGLTDIKARKGLDAKEDLLDRAGRAELAANEFRITQTEGRLTRDKISGDLAARETHRQVGEAVRTTIQQLGGTTPENLKPEASIKKLARGKGRAKKKLSEGGS